MHLNKPSKIVLGILTFLPLIFGVGSFIMGIYQILSLIISEDPAMPLMFISFLSHVFPYLFFFFLIYLALGIFYLVHIIQNESMDGEKQFLWVVVLIILNGIAMPVYWYLHVWKEQNSEANELNPNFDKAYESGTESQKL